jgi:nucleotide-binding universal stress UspA family protein
MKGFAKILCVLQRIEDSDPAFTRAVSLAELNQAHLTVANVVPRLASETRRVGVEGAICASDSFVDEQQVLLESLIAPYRGRVEIEAKVVVGIGYLEVVREVLRERHDLVVKTVLPQKWLSRLLSGDDIHLLRECPCPVWLIKSQGSGKVERVLAPIDADDCYPPKELGIRRQLNASVVEIAASLAMQHSADLHVAYAWQSWYEMARGLSFSSGVAQEKWEAGAREERVEQQNLLDKAVRDMRSDSEAVQSALDYLRPALHLSHGPAAKEIPVLADVLRIDCVVMGTVARTGIRGFLMGNTAEEILDQISCSVLAIKPRGFVTSVGMDD